MAAVSVNNLQAPTARCNSNDCFHRTRVVHESDFVH